jgi:hypothetical protein
MAIGSCVVLEGVLTPEGTVQFQTRPALPPGRVRVRLEAVPAPGAESERLPDPLWLDDGVPAPSDLPQPDGVEQVEPREVSERRAQRLAFDDEP